ncbi:MAG: energy-coupling factor ABC transporter permease [Anaerobutyricum sp.]|nr:energy-coupling factor ABC transporter permease [Eubacterium sp.]MDY6047658.1 energy-coupling factor ABC transporter permease [Anaerobutyricum sp.]
MLKKKEKLSILAVALLMLFAVAPVSNAMHVMEGFLPVTHCVIWIVICIPFLVIGIRNIKKLLDNNRKTLMILALTGAFVFVLSSLKIPSVTGSCSHMTGTGLGAILFGPCITSILGIIVLIFQAVLLAHGGLTTLGANCFSMAIAGPILSYVIYKALKKANVNKKVTVFLAACLGDLFTYCVTSFELAIAYPSEVGGIGASMAKFLGVFATTQVPLAIIEGILTVIIVIGLETYAKDELKSLDF